MSTEKRVRATFAGSVAALWLEYVHGLIGQQQAWDWSKSNSTLYNELCDRIENDLTHLERSSMPLPDMTIEDVIQMGADMQADEDMREELEQAARDRGEENFVQELSSGVWGVYWRRAGDVNARAAWFSSEEEAVAILADEAGRYKLVGEGDGRIPDSRIEDVAQEVGRSDTNNKVRSVDTDAVQGPDGDVATVPNVLSDKERPEEQASSDNVNGMSGHRPARAARRGLCSKCGYHIRSRIHTEQCLGKTYVNPRDLNRRAHDIVQQATSEADPLALAECIHHWKIDPPNGSGDIGATCRKCESRREFKSGELVKLPTRGAA